MHNQPQEEQDLKRRRDLMVEQTTRRLTQRLDIDLEDDEPLLLPGPSKNNPAPARPLPLPPPVPSNPPVDASAQAQSQDASRPVSGGNSAVSRLRVLEEAIAQLPPNDALRHYLEDERARVILQQAVLPSVTRLIGVGTRKVEKQLARPPIAFSLLFLAIVCGLACLWLYDLLSPAVVRCAAGTLSIARPTTLAPLVDDLTTSYTQSCHGSAHFQENADINQSTIIIGTSATLGSQTAVAHVGHPIAVVVYALVSNGINGVSSLTTQQVQKIYNGTYTDWQQVGYNKSLPITLISPPAGSDSQVAFVDHLLGMTPNNTGIELTNDNTDTLVAYLQEIPGALTYVPLDYAQRNKLHILAVDGQLPTTDTIKKGSYRFWSVIYIYTQGDVSDLTQAFIAYTQTDSATTIVRTHGTIALKDLSPNLLHAHEAGT